MNELIKINIQLIGVNEVNSVNARELHSSLEIKQRFGDWIKSQIKRAGLRENIDYISFKQNSDGGRPTTDYAITTEASKHIAMMSQGKKSSEIRDYFIAVEREYIESLKKDTHEVAHLKQTILDQNKIIATMTPEKESNIFMNDSQMHNNFLDFLYQANKITHEVNAIRHLSPKVDITHQSMSNFMAFITRRYENIKGVDKFKMPENDPTTNNYIVGNLQKAK